MDKKTLAQIERTELLTWLVSQDDVRAQSELLMALLEDIGIDIFDGSSVNDITTLKQAFRRVVFEAAVKHYGHELAVELLECSKVHAESVIEGGAERCVELIIK